MSQLQTTVVNLSATPSPPVGQYIVGVDIDGIYKKKNPDGSIINLEFGGGSTSTLIQNSILFAGVGGAVSQDNTRFYWDDTNTILNVSDGSLPGPSGDFNFQKSVNGYSGLNVVNPYNSVTISAATYFGFIAGGTYNGFAMAKYSKSSTGSVGNLPFSRSATSAINCTDVSDGNGTLIISATPIVLSPGDPFASIGVQQTRYGLRNDLNGIRIGTLDTLGATNTYPFSINSNLAYTTANKLYLGTVNSSDIEQFETNYTLNGGGISFSRGSVAHTTTLTGSCISGQTLFSTASNLLDSGVTYTGTLALIAHYITQTTTYNGNTININTPASQAIGNQGLNVIINGTNTGLNLGGEYDASGANLNIGIFGKAVGSKISSVNIGVLGNGLNGGSPSIQIGGYFGLMSVTPALTTSAALIADVGTQTVPLLVGKSNGSTVLSVDQTGTVIAGTWNASYLARVQVVASAASVTPNAAANDAVSITALAVGLTINNAAGTPTNFQKLSFRILDNGTSRSIAWGTTYVPMGTKPLPLATVAGKIMLVAFVYDSVLGAWGCVAINVQA
jgi:hypothetical protein